MASEKWIVCRICLQQPNEKMECIFDVDPKKDMTQIILDCGGVPIKQFDHYPDKICSKCLRHLRIAHKFRETCRRSYNHLSRFIAPIEIESGDKSADEQQPELIVPSDDAALALTEDENNQATVQAASIEMESEQQYVVQLRADDGVVIDAVVGDYGGNVKEEYDEDLEGAEIVDEVTEDVVDIYAPMDDDNFEEIDDFEPVNREDQNIAEVVEYLDDIGAGLTSDEEYSPKISANARKVQRGRGRPPKTETQTKKLALHASSGKGIEGLMELRREKLKRYPRFKDKDGKLKTFICDVCGNIYPTQGRLKEHIKSHNGVKPHECEICGHAFAQNQQLARHMNTHTGNRPYKCNYCPSAFADLSTRNKHHRIHTNERPYACDVCGKAFAYTNTLKFHKMIHTGEKPFVCEICGKGFHQAYKLRNHKVTHEKRGIKIEKYDTDSVIEIYQEVSDATDVILKSANC